MINHISVNIDTLFLEFFECRKQAFINVFAESRIDDIDQLLLKVKGKTVKESIDVVSEERALSLSKEEFYTRFFKEYSALLGQFRFDRKIILNLKKAGLGLCVLSRESDEFCSFHLSLLGLGRNEAELVITGTEDIYGAMLEKSELKTSDIICIETEVSLIRKAVGLGLDVIGISVLHDDFSLIDAGAKFSISSLSALSFVESAEDFYSLMEDNKKTNEINRKSKLLDDDFILSRMLVMAKKVRENAYTPYSGFKVGAAVLSGKTGRIYTGCNVENASYGATICAERNAVLNAVATEGEFEIGMLVVVTSSDPPSPPCALCLQVLAEFTKPETKIILSDLEGRSITYQFKELLPNPFVLK